MHTQINIRQVKLGPEVPLGRRGCLMEESLSHQEASGWADTFFANAVIRTGIKPVISILRERGEEVFTILKRIMMTATVPATFFFHATFFFLGSRGPRGEV